MGIIGVSFKKNSKIYYFNSNDIELTLNDYVIVETEKGLQFGFVSLLNVNNNDIDVNKLKNIVRKASDDDYNKYLKNLKNADIALKDTRQKVIDDQINMKIIDASYTFDKKQLMFNFIADERVDFRELVKYLAAKYKTRIELHQIGARDKAKEVGGIGQCGMPLCCKVFKSSMDGISINMAKNQNISLNPSKINGCCGRLLCCLSYEDENYKESKRILPKIKDQISVDKVKCEVINVDLLNRKVTVNFNGESRVIDYNDK